MLLCVIGEAALGASERVWTFYAKGMPKAKSCTEDAVTLGERLTQHTGLRVYSVGAEEDGKRCDLNVSYYSTWPLRDVTTGTNLGVEFTEPSSAIWAYRTIAECESALSQQGEKFTAATGVKVFVAYCRPEDNVATEANWVAAHIVGFGDPKRVPRRWVGPALRDERQAKLDAVILNAVGKRADIYHHSPDAGEGSVFHYYAEPLRPFPVTSLVFGGYDEMADCELELADARAIVEKEKSKIHFVGCSARQAGRPSEVAVVYDRPIASQLRKHELYELHYSDVKTCRDDKERVVTHYAKTFGWNIAGALCGAGVSGDIMVTLFTR